MPVDYKGIALEGRYKTPISVPLSVLAVLLVKLSSLTQLMRCITDTTYMYFNKESSENREGEKDPLTQQVIGCAIEVHRTLGPGLLESTYEKCLAHELKLAGLPFINQAPISVPLSVLAVLFVKLSSITQLLRCITDTIYMHFNKESSENREGEKDPLTRQVIGCAIEVHRTLGPGLLESTYEKCLAHELKLCPSSIRQVSFSNSSAGG
jgi:hypothetical protein